MSGPAGHDYRVWANFWTVGPIFKIQKAMESYGLAQLFGGLKLLVFGDERQETTQVSIFLKYMVSILRQNDSLWGGVRVCNGKQYSEKMTAKVGHLALFGCFWG